MTYDKQNADKVESIPLYSLKWTPSRSLASELEHLPKRGMSTTEQKEGPSSLELAQMPQRREVWKPNDDWTGITSAAERRKLQNRLNQRLYRKRRRRTTSPYPISDGNPPIDLASDSPAAKGSTHEIPLLGKFKGLIAAVELSLPDSTDNSPKIACSSQSRLSRDAGCHLPYISQAQLDTMIAKFEEMAYRDYMLGSPRVDQLLTLIQFNVFRALINNTLTLGWTLEWLTCAEPISPWNAIDTNRNKSLLVCPQALRPTAVQRAIEHHPWIDLWPMPRMRDNLLLAGDSYDEDQLCNDLVEFTDVPNEQTGLIVWSDPWDTMGWEVSEMFLRKWGWTVKGCVELLESTNYWRGKRGEKPLFF